MEERERMTPEMCSLITPMQGSACRSVGVGTRGRGGGAEKGRQHDGELKAAIGCATDTYVPVDVESAGHP